MFLNILRLILKTNYLLQLFIVSFVFSQENHQQTLTINEIQRIEESILKQEYSLIKNIFDNQDVTQLSQYQKLLYQIALQKKTSYKDNYTFLANASSIPGITSYLSDYIDSQIKKPEKFKILDYDYVKIKWLQMMVLADETSTLDKAKKIKFDLLNYIENFDENSKETIKARALVETFELLIYVIQKEIDKGKKLSIATANLGQELDDKLIQITGLYHLCDFLVEERNLEEFIRKSEAVLEIEATLKTPSPYKIKNMVHLIDAYIFKGGDDLRVYELINKLYENTKTRPHSYSLYAQFLSELPETSSLQQEIFKKFDVQSYIAFGNKIDSISQNVLIPNEYYHVLNFTSKMLFSKKLYNEAFRYKEKAVLITRKSYSEDLAKSLADFQTEKAVQQKERELLLTKQKSKYYGIIACLVAALLTVTLYLLYINTKKNKILKQKNTLIGNTLLEKENLLNEKQLLFKEMHHRVKNNFQLLSSLLELQVTDVKDEKALKMVEEGQNRIKSMALIHQNLYGDDSLKISINDYIKKLVKQISTIGNSNPSISLNIPDLKFDVDTAIPLGLILNELITNSFKYGLTNKTPALSISIEKVKNSPFFKLIVKDNGSGLNNKIQFYEPDSMGLWLVQRLVKQLSGKSEYKYDKGAVFLIWFKDTQERLEVA